MKTTTFKNITVQDFCTHRGLKSFNLGHRTFIKGANETGKSTIKKAIQYALNICAENGKEITGIRPHDDNGVDYDGLTTMSQLTVSVDGVENTVKKTFFQKKNREGAYTGENDTQYFVDDVKKGTKKAYDEFIGSFLPNSLCINPQEFLLKNAPDRRMLLEQAFSKHSVDDIIAENPKFEELRGKLKANTVADIKKACRTKIDGTKAQNYQDGLNGQLAKVNNQIEFEQTSKKDIDLAELELQRNALKEQIADIEAKESDVSKQYEEYDKQSKDILDLQFALSDLERKANEELSGQRKELRERIGNKEFNLQDIECAIGRSELEIEGYQNDIESREKERERLLEKYDKVSKEVFDENTPVCPTCHRELPQEERERLLSTFETTKAERLEEIQKEGLGVKQDIDNATAMLPQVQEKWKELIAKKEEVKKEITDLTQQLSALPTSADISDREDAKAIKQRIADKEQAMQNCNSADEIRQELRDKKSDLQTQLIEVEAQFKVSEENAKADDRIADLQKKRTEIVQQTADIQRELDLLKEFERRKAEILETDVNSVFEFAKVKMFEPQVNGELKDICTFTYKGESYDRNLNHGARILIEIDICRAFQKMYDVCLPIIIDDSESVDSWRIPQIENQLIAIMRTDDKELKVECMEDGK